MRKHLSILVILVNILGILSRNLQCEIQHFDWHYADGEICVASFEDIKFPNRIFETLNSSAKKPFNNTVKIIDIYRKTVFYIPEGFNKFFPEIEGFQIYDSKLKEVQKKDFAQFPNLKELLLNSNELRVLPSDLFEANRKLVSIEFENNKLFFVAANILKPSRNLEKANFYGNPCIDQCAENKKDIPSIVNLLEQNCRSELIEEYEQIKKSSNDCEKKLEAVDGNLDTATHQLFMSSKPSVQQIEIPTLDMTCVYLNVTKTENSTENANATCVLAPNQTITLNVTKENYKFPPESIKIFCAYNPFAESCTSVDLIVKTPHDTITQVLHEDGQLINQNIFPIQKLKIIDQQTMFLPLKLGEMFPLATEVTVVNSGVFWIDKNTFANLTLMTSLKITKNKIREIRADSFGYNVNLTDLDLSFNNIESIEDNAFESLEKLIKLSLEHNLLTSLRAEVFRNLESLQTLKLQYNKLRFINSNLISKIPQLTSIDISNNEIEYLSGNIVPVDNGIIEFRASENKLFIIEHKLIKRLKNSELIDFSGNNCTDIIYEKYSMESMSINSLLSQIYLDCSTEDD